MIDGQVEIARLASAAAHAKTPQERASLARELASLSAKLRAQTETQVEKARAMKAKAVDIIDSLNRNGSVGSSQEWTCTHCGYSHEHWDKCGNYSIRNSMDEQACEPVTKHFESDPFKDPLEPF